MSNLRRFWGRNGILLICICFASAFMILLVAGHPLKALGRSHDLMTDSRILIGPYPDASDLRRLADQRVQTIISLLDPRIPYEAVLASRERKVCDSLGLRLLNFPMTSILGLPFGRQYNVNAERAVQTALNTQGKIYIHCYLGLHRARVVHTLLLNRHAPVTRDPFPTRFQGGPDPDLEKAQSLFDEARYAECLKALTTHTGVPTSRMTALKAWTYYKLNRIPEARETFSSLAHDPAIRLDCLRGSAYCDLQRGQYAKAGEAFMALLTANPSDVMALEGMGLVCYREGRQKDAAGFFDEVLRTEPGHPEAAAVLARLRHT